MDIDFIMEVLEKHKINNIELARDIQTLAKECYLDGKFDEGEWWMVQDKDKDWIDGWNISEVGDYPALPSEYIEYCEILENKHNEALDSLLNRFNGKEEER